MKIKIIQKEDFALNAKKNFNIWLTWRCPHVRVEQLVPRGKSSSRRHHGLFFAMWGLQVVGSGMSDFRTGSYIPLVQTFPELTVVLQPATRSSGCRTPCNIEIQVNNNSPKFKKHNFHIHTLLTPIILLIQIFQYTFFSSFKYFHYNINLLKKKKMSI